MFDLVGGLGTRRAAWLGPAMNKDGAAQEVLKTLRDTVSLRQNKAQAEMRIGKVGF